MQMIKAIYYGKAKWRIEEWENVLQILPLSLIGLIA